MDQHHRMQPGEDGIDIDRRIITGPVIDLRHGRFVRHPAQHDTVLIHIVDLAVRDDRRDGIRERRLEGTVLRRNIRRHGGIPLMVAAGDDELIRRVRQ